ncbi:unnamed protein product [Oikopleura dioica]|uniref:FZ domain-containing protein n=1 Tax=Oikopleura dioica TaxID=34765 RepID=E4YIU1_OIKDI|nr:unnamed protein product [Oikopleura dioica]
MRALFVNLLLLTAARKRSRGGHSGNKDNSKTEKESGLENLVSKEISQYGWPGQHECVEIPKEFEICHNITGSGQFYRTMWLPNFMKHETLDEVIQQSRSWKPVLSREKIEEVKEVQKFICSMYAPVCLPSGPKMMIPPCRELCESVKDQLLPKLQENRFGWPDSLACDRFPRQADKGGLCIPPDEKRSSRPSEKNNELSKCRDPESFCLLGSVADNDEMTIREHFCSFDIVFIAKIKKIKARKRHIQVKFKIKKDKVDDNFTATEEKKLKKWFYLADAGSCYNAKKCSVLDNAKKGKNNLLVMAKSDKNRKNVVMHLTNWDNHNESNLRNVLKHAPQHCCRNNSCKH